MKKLAILGASYLQIPLIKKTRELGIESHVFSWEKGICEHLNCDYYYQISITEKEQILQKCKEIQINGITSIGSDLAMPTVNYVADQMNLIGNSIESCFVTTNKYAMREKLSEQILPCPRFEKINSVHQPITEKFSFPFIIKPTDRSGSRGVAKIYSQEKIGDALERALSESHIKEAIIEDFIPGKEISVEMISWQGKHYFITCTDKVITGEPYFVEIEQHVPANITSDMQNRIITLVKEALTVLGVEYGASHSELMITAEGEIYIVEIGARMGGDNIGSDLVPLCTGYDYVKAVVEIALGEFTIPEISQMKYAGISYLTPKAGRVKTIIDTTADCPDIVRSEILVNIDDNIIYPVKDSSQRSAYIIYASDQMVNIDPEQVIQIVTE